MNSVRVRLVCGLAAGVVLAAAGAVQGQEAQVRTRVVDGAQPVEATQPMQVTVKKPAREPKIDRYARVLGLDDEQRDVARDLNTAYERSSAEAGKSMHAAMKDAQTDMDEGDRAAFEEKIQKAMKSQREKSKELRDQFLSDLKSLLRADQEDNWVKLDRLRRRESMLGGMFGMGGQTLGGSGVDLVPMVRRMEIPDAAKAKVDEMLGMYEVDVDRPLQDRERNFEGDQEKMGAVRQFTPETFKAQQERDRAVDLKVREVNDKYVRLIGAELPEELARRLDDEYRAKSFKNAYRSTSVGRELAAAEKVKGLTEKQREQLKAMQERYKRDAKAAGDKLAAAMRRAEDEGKSAGGGPLMLTGPGHEGEIDPQIADAKAQRKAIDTALRDDMERLLSPQQLADAQEAAKPHGMSGHRIEVVGDGMSEDMVFISDFELDEDFEGDEGGGAMMIIQTVDVVAPTPAQPSEEPK